jgi:hypothetical protein
MIMLKKRNSEIFSIKEMKENPFTLLNNIIVHKNKNIYLLKESKQEWAYEYFLIYNSENKEQI